MAKIGAIAVLLGVAVCGCAGPRKAAPLTVHGPLAPADEVARDVWQRPQAILNQMRVQPGQVVVDFGAGAGYLLARLSQAVGPDGQVIAVEVQPELVQRLRQRAAAEKLDNVQVVQSTEVSVGLGALADRIILLHSYAELAQPVQMMAALKQWLKPGGRVYAVEFLPPPDPAGLPLPLSAPQHRVAPDTLEAELRGAGLIATQRYAVLPHQYFAMFVPEEELTPALVQDRDLVPLPDSATPPSR